MRHYRSDDFPHAGVEPPRQIGAPGAAGLADVRQSQRGSAGVGLAADPVSGEAEQASPSGSQLASVDVATESVETSLQIGAPGAAGIVDGRQTPVVVGGVEQAANPVGVGAVQAPPSDAKWSPVAAAIERSEPSWPIGAPGAAGIADVCQSQRGSAGVGLAADPVAGEAEQASPSGSQLASVDVATESVEPSLQIGAPGAAGIVDGRQSPTVRGGVERAADPAVGEAAQSSSSAANHPPVAVASMSNPIMSIRVGYKPDDEVSGVSPVDPPISVYLRVVYIHVGQCTLSCCIAMVKVSWHVHNFDCPTLRTLRQRGLVMLHLAGNL